MREPAPTLARVLQATAEAFDLPVAALRSRRRSAPVVRARHGSIWLCRRLTPASLSEIARAHDLDHSTVVHALRRIGDLRQRDPYFRDRLDRIALRLLSNGAVPDTSTRLRAVCDAVSAAVAADDGALSLDDSAAAALVQALAGIVDEVMALERRLRAVAAVRPPVPDKVVDLDRERRRRAGRCGTCHPGGGDAA